MRVIKYICWTLLCLCVGLLGSAAIVVMANSYIGSDVKISGGPFVYVDGWERGYVSAEGTLTIDNDRSAFPLQVTKLRCMQGEKICQGATAEIGFGKTLHLSLFRHDILLWNSTTLIFREDAPCLQYVYTIDRTSKRLVGTRTKKPNVPGCEIFEDRPLSLSLVNGFDIWWKLHQEATARVTPFMWSGMAVWWIVVGLFGWMWRPRRSISS